MWWRLRAAEWRAGKGAKNRAALRRLVTRAGRAPGLLAYSGDECIGWVAVEPRADYPRLAGSRVLAPLDDSPVWSITCFFVAQAWRGRGVALRLLEGAVDFARRQGARELEAYNNSPRDLDLGPRGIPNFTADYADGAGELTPA